MRTPILAALVLLTACHATSAPPTGAGGSATNTTGAGAAPSGGGAGGLGGAGGTCPASALPGCLNAVCDSDAYCAAQAAGWCDDSQPCQDPCGGPVHMGRCWPPRVDLEPCDRPAQCFAGVCSGGLCGAGHDGGVSLADAGG